MDQRDDDAGAAGDACDTERLRQDWITIWQSELAALTADPELRDWSKALLAAWAKAAAAAVPPSPHPWPADGAGMAAQPGRSPAADAAAPIVAGTSAAPGPAATAAPSDDVRSEIEHLRRRIVRLEQRVEDLGRDRAAS